jgi:hypothetical protein
MFSSKNNAKYFLTIIGDNILKKNSHLLFLVGSQFKKILTNLENVASHIIGVNNIASNFITKYHENNSYDKYRLLKINDNYSIELWYDILHKIGLNLLCVATHYSKRYTDSDKFIDRVDDEFKSYVNYIKHKTSDEVVDDFCKNYIICSDDTHLEWKNLHFLWKQFLSDNNLPNMIYYSALKNILKEKYKSDEENDKFIGITSKYLPVQKDFISFWESTITKNVAMEDNFDNELEIDELCVLFKIWNKEYNSNNSINCTIHDESVLQIIRLFFSDVEVIENKYVLNISCVLWDITNDIYESLEYIRNNIKNNELLLISFNDVYKHYYDYCIKMSKRYIVSKRYFEKYLYYKLSDYIVYDKFIECDKFIQSSHL